jgi:hypothetical protein
VISNRLHEGILWNSAIWDEISVFSLRSNSHIGIMTQANQNDGLESICKSGCHPGYSKWVNLIWIQFIYNDFYNRPNITVKSAVIGNSVISNITNSGPVPATHLNLLS